VGFSLYWVQHEEDVRIKRLNTMQEVLLISPL
jgi:hypothetical protein